LCRRRHCYCHQCHDMHYHLCVCVRARMRARVPAFLERCALALAPSPATVNFN
jgi:hypothetical protein